MARYNKESLVEDLLLHDIFADVTKTKTRQFVDDLLDIIQERVVAGDEVTFRRLRQVRKIYSTKRIS